VLRIREVRRALPQKGRRRGTAETTRDTWSAADRVQRFNRVGGQRKRGGGHVLAQVGDGRRARDEGDGGGALQQPGEGNLLGRRSELGGDALEHIGLERREAAEREERRESDVLTSATVDEFVVLAVRQVVEVLHGDDRSDRLRLGELPGGDIADPKVANEPLPPQLGENAERLPERVVGRAVVFADTQVDDVERFYAEVPDVAVHRVNEALTRAIQDPGSVVAPDGTHLGDDVQTLGVGIQRLLDQLVDDEGP